MPGEHLDISSDPFAEGKSPDSDQESRANSRVGRRFLGVTFACCDIYARIYINKDETAYEGRCPRCCKPLQLRIGPGGVDARFFTAY